MNCELTVIILCLLTSTMFALGLVLENILWRVLALLSFYIMLMIILLVL